MTNGLPGTGCRIPLTFTLPENRQKKQLISKNIRNILFVIIVFIIIKAQYFDACPPIWRAILLFGSRMLHTVAAHPCWLVPTERLDGFSFTFNVFNTNPTTGR